MYLLSLVLANVAYGLGIGAHVISEYQLKARLVKSLQAGSQSQNLDNLCDQIPTFPQELQITNVSVTTDFDHRDAPIGVNIQASFKNTASHNLQPTPISLGYPADWRMTDFAVEDQIGYYDPPQNTTTGTLLVADVRPGRKFHVTWDFLATQAANFSFEVTTERFLYKACAEKHAPISALNFAITDFQLDVNLDSAKVVIEYENYNPTGTIRPTITFSGTLDQAFDIKKVTSANGGVCPAGNDSKHGMTCQLAIRAGGNHDSIQAQYRARGDSANEQHPLAKLYTFTWAVDYALTSPLLWKGSYNQRRK